MCPSRRSWRKSAGPKEGYKIFFTEARQSWGNTFQILIGKYRNSKVRHQEKEKKGGKGKQKQDQKKKTNPTFSEQNLSHVYFTPQTALPHSLQLDL